MINLFMMKGEDKEQFNINLGPNHHLHTFRYQKEIHE